MATEEERSNTHLITGCPYVSPVCHNKSKVSTEHLTRINDTVFLNSWKDHLTVRFSLNSSELKVVINLCIRYEVLVTVLKGLHPFVKSIDGKSMENELNFFRRSLSMQWWAAMESSQVAKGRPLS